MGVAEILRQAQDDETCPKALDSLLSGAPRQWYLGMPERPPSASAPCMGAYRLRRGCFAALSMIGLPWRTTQDDMEPGNPASDVGVGLPAQRFAAVTHKG
jgi:hypothetical protein